MEFFDSKECEWSDLTFFLDGVKVIKFTGLKYKKMRELEALYAGGDEPLSLQSGNKGYEGTLTMLKGAVDAVNKAVLATGQGEDILDGEYIIVANYRAKGSRLIQTDTLVGVKVSEFERGMMQNDKKMEIALPFKYLRLNPANAALLVNT